MHVSMNGVRLERSEFYQAKYYSVVVAPALDAFSAPTKYRVTSEKPLGNPNTLLDLDLRMRGFVRQRPFTDKATGQQKLIDEASVYFDVDAVRLSPAPKS